MQEMNIYTTNFEPCLIHDTALFYGKESMRLFSKLNVPEYLQFAARRRSMEEKQQTGLAFTTRVSLSAIVADKFIRLPLKDILAKGTTK